MPIATERLSPADNPELSRPTLGMDAAGIPVIEGDANKAASLRYFAENWRGFTNVDAVYAGRTDVPEQARGLTHGEQVFALGMEQVLIAIDRRSSSGLETETNAYRDERGREFSGNRPAIDEADNNIKKEIAGLFEPDFLNGCGLTEDGARELVSGVLTDLMWDDMRTVILPVSDEAAEAISVTHRLDHLRAHRALHPNEARLAKLREDYPGIGRRWLTRAWRFAVPPPDEHQSHRPGRVEVSRWKKRDLSSRPIKGRKRGRSFIHPLRPGGPRGELDDARSSIESLMERELTDAEFQSVLAVGIGEDKTILTKREREARMDGVHMGLSAAVEELGGPIMEKRHRFVESRIKTITETFRQSDHLSSEVPDQLEELAVLCEMKNLCLAGWEHGQAPPGHLRDNLVRILDEWNTKLQNLDVITPELVEELVRGYYQLFERDIEHQGLTPHSTMEFAADPEYRDRGIIVRESVHGRVREMILADGTRRFEDAATWDPATNPHALGARENFTPPEGLDAILSRSDRNLGPVEADALFAIYDQERTPQSAAEAWIAMRFVAEGFENEVRLAGEELAQLRLTEHRSPTGVDPDLVDAAEERLERALAISQEARRRQAWLEGQMQGFVEGFFEPASARIKLGRFAVGVVQRATGGRVNMTAPQPPQRDTEFDPNGDIVWHNGRGVDEPPAPDFTVDPPVVPGSEELYGTFVFNSQGDVVDYIPV